MGSIVGCAKNLCNERTTKEISIDIIKNNNNKYEHIYTINSTSKNEQTKPALLPQENDNDEIKEIKNEKEYIEKEEEKQNIEENIEENNDENKEEEKKGGKRK